VGLLDGAPLLRLTIAPEARRDEELARRLAADVSEPECGVLPAGKVSVEVRAGAPVKELLAAAGWGVGEPWTPLRRDLAGPVADPGVRVEVAGPELAPVRTAVQRAAFGRPPFPDVRWRAVV